LYFIITSKQHKIQGKEVSIIDEFTILFEIRVPHKRLHVYYFMNVLLELHENIMQNICALNVFQLS
jgi:hypothetical protein